MSIDSIIAQAVSKAVKELYGVESAPETIVPQATRKEFEGNLTVVVFSLATSHSPISAATASSRT